MIVLDTSIVSEILQGQENALNRLKHENPADLVICTPVIAEIQFGLEHLEAGSRRRMLLESQYQLLRQTLVFVAWDEAAARHFGSSKAELQRQGTPIADMDLAIASVALALGARVATRNHRHFERIPGLVIDPWT